MAKSDEKQIDKFKAAAKEAGADMDEKSFDEVLGKLAKSAKPETREAAQKADSSKAE